MRSELSLYPNDLASRSKEKRCTENPEQERQREGRETLFHAGNGAGHVMCSSSEDIFPELWPTARGIDETVKKQDEKTQSRS